MAGCRNDLVINSLQSHATFLSNHKLNSISTMKTNFELNSDVYGMMRENALFLLELSSSGSGWFILFIYFSGFYNGDFTIHINKLPCLFRITQLF